MHERGIVLPRNEFLDSALAQIRRDSFSAARRGDFGARAQQSAWKHAVINRMEKPFRTPV
jgi:hypothetical protein